MRNAGALTKTLAVAGAVLVWTPVLAGLTAAAMGVGDGSMTALWYVPAALFPAAVIGGVLLVWVSWRAGSRRALVGWSFGVAVGALIAAMVFTTATGLASGAREAVPPWTTIGSALFAAYALADLVLAVASILLARDVFARGRADAAARDAGGDPDA